MDRRVSDGLRTTLQQTLGDTYTLERELGGGGMSRVFVARENALGGDVVVKVLAPELSASVSAERFTREIATGARLQQANIVPVLSAGTSGEISSYTMPIVKGESLRAQLARGSTLSLPDRLTVLRHVARALAYAHSEGGDSPRHQARQHSAVGRHRRGHGLRHRESHQCVTNDRQRRTA